MSNKNVNKKRKNIKEKILNNNASKEVTLTKKENLKKDLINFLIIFLLSLVYFLGVLDSDVIFDAHDLMFHTSNIITIERDLSLTNLIPNRILPTLVNNLGYGVNLFYPNLPHMVGAYFYHFIGDIGLTIKILFLVLINISGIAMYKLIEKLFKNKEQALITSLTYISMPYFFSDFFIRCALNESFLFFIIPIILLGIHYLIDDNNKIKFYLYFVLGYVLAINSHLVMSVYLTIILGIYLLVHRKKVFERKNLISFIIASIFIILLTLNFTVPLLEHNHLGIYNILNIEYKGARAVQTTNTFNYLLPIKHLDMPMYIPPLMTIILGYIFFKLKDIKKEHKNTLLGMYIILIFSIFLATNYRIWDYLPNIIKNIQFSWRMSLFVVIAVTIIFGYSINLLNKNLRKPFIILFILIYIVTNSINAKLIVNIYPEPEDYLITNEEHQWGKEYLPVVSVINIPDIRSKKLALTNSKTGAKIDIIDNSVPNMEFNVKNIKEELTIEFPRIYYLGYKLTDQDGKNYKLTMNNSGLIEATISKDSKYKLEYTGTKLENSAYIISLLSYAFFLFYLIFLKYNKKRGVKDAK